MSKAQLVFDNGEAYDRLMREVVTLGNVAFVAKGKMPDHLHTRLEKSAKAAQDILRDNVAVVKEEEA